MTDRNLKQDVFLLISTVFLCLLAGAIIFSYIEGWTLFDSFYFVTMTATTVGYGDFTPATHLGKFFTMIFALSIIPFVLYTFSFVARAQMNRVYRKIHNLEKLQEEEEEELSEAQKILKEQERILAMEKKELGQQKRGLLEETKVNEEQEKELEEHDKRLNAVEAVSAKRSVSSG